MPLTDITAAAQDYLLGIGDTNYLTLAVQDVLQTLGRRLPLFTDIRVVTHTWYEGAWTDSTTTFTDNTTNAQQGGGNVPLSTLTANDGILLGASGLFARVDCVMQTVHAGGVPVYEWTYWDGTTWSPLSTQSTPNFGALGTTSLMFEPPVDWVQGPPSGVTFSGGFDTNQFWLRLRATTAPSGTAAVASQLIVYTAVFPLPDQTLALLFATFYPNELERVPVRAGLDLLNPDWRTLTGLPTFYTQDLDRPTRVRVAPIPNAALGVLPALAVFAGLPWAVAPTNNLVVGTVHAPAVEEVPQFFEELVALALAAQEAQRQGDTHDPTLAQSLDALAQMVTTLVVEVFTSTP